MAFTNVVKKVRSQNVEVKVKRGVAECTVCGVEIGFVGGQYLCAGDCGAWAPVYENIMYDESITIRLFRGMGDVYYRESSINEDREICDVLRSVPKLGALVAFRRLYRPGKFTMRDVTMGHCTQRQYDLQREHRATAQARAESQADSGIRKLVNQGTPVYARGI